MAPELVYRVCLFAYASLQVCVCICVRVCVCVYACVCVYNCICVGVFVQCGCGSGETN